MASDDQSSNIISHMISHMRWSSVAADLICTITLMPPPRPGPGPLHEAPPCPLRWRCCGSCSVDGGGGHSNRSCAGVCQEAKKENEGKSSNSSHRDGGKQVE